MPDDAFVCADDIRAGGRDAGRAVARRPRDDRKDHPSAIGIEQLLGPAARTGILQSHARPQHHDTVFGDTKLARQSHTVGIG
jgi:hypothetical protein